MNAATIATRGPPEFWHLLLFGLLWVIIIAVVIFLAILIVDRESGHLPAHKHATNTTAKSYTFE